MTQKTTAKFSTNKFSNKFVVHSLHFSILSLVLFLIKRTSRRRAISDIIVTLLLVSLTVVGGTIVFITISENEQIKRIDSSAITPSSDIRAAIKIFGYDTRDGSGLGGISDLGNTNDDSLTTDEYIVLYVRNTGNQDLFLAGIQVNEVSHSWDTTQGTLSSSLPATGKFVIISIENDSDPQMNDYTVRSSAQINQGTDVRVILKLASDFSGNNIIKLNKAVRINLDITGFDINNFIISSGTAI